MEGHGDVKGYFRIVEFEGGSIVETKMSMSGLSNLLLRTMESDEYFARTIEMAMKRYELRKDPMGKVLDMLMQEKAETDRDKGEPCNCEKCQNRRAAEN